MLGQEVELRTQNADRYIDFLVRVFRDQKILERRAISGRVEPREIELLAIDFNAVEGVGAQCTHEIRVEDRQAGKVGTLVKQQHDVTRRGRSRQEATSPQN